MDNVKEQKCKNCGAPLRFDPESGLLVCDNCGTKTEIPAELKESEVVVNGLDYNELAQQVMDENAENLPVYRCVSCSAEVIAPAEQIATTCPYCGNNIVLTDKISGKLRPDGVIPFRIDKKHLPDAMNSFYKGKVLMPKRFFSESTMSKVTGVYVPFWIFSGRLDGVLRYHAESGTTHRNGDYLVTNTRHYEVRKHADLTFRDVPVDASGRIDDVLMDSLEPFDMADEKPFDMRYLAGFTADRFDQAKSEVADRAKNRMVNTVENTVLSSVLREYGAAYRTGGDLRAQLKARYLLLPVYLFSIAYEGKDYEFAVNGQSGKVVGDVPTSKSVSAGYFGKRAGVVAAVIIGIFAIKYLLGA